MELIEGIEAFEKEAAEKIKIAEDRKKSIVALGASAQKARDSLNADVKSVVQRLANVIDSLDLWQAGYDSWIEGLKESIKNYARDKKKAVEAEKFFKQLSEEKAEKEKTAKANRNDDKAAKDFQLFMAVYKKAETAYHCDITKFVEQDINYLGSTVRGMEDCYKDIVSETEKAVADYMKLLDQFRAFAKERTAVAKWGGWEVPEKTLSSEFSGYFKLLSK